MNILDSRTRAGGAVMVLAAALTLGGCATQEYVDEQVAGVRTQLSSQISTLDGRVTAHDSHLAKLDADMQATAKLAAGKFNHTKVTELPILFDTGSSKLSQDAQTALTDLATRLKAEDKNVFLEIEGFADPTGSVAKNRLLGLERAGNVYGFLRDQGIALNHMTVISHGEEHQIGPPGSPSARKENRRAIVTVID